MIRPGEKGAILKTGGPVFPVALVYPNVYRVGMGNLGFQFLYEHLNSFPGVAAERFFLPDPSIHDERTRFDPVSEESGRPLKGFRLIAFSIPFANDYPRVPQMLLAAGIPPLENERGASDPVVIGGGIAVSLNPEPLASFFDLIFIGEIDDRPGPERSTLFSLLIEALTDSSGRKLERTKLHRLFREVPGAYVPAAYDFEIQRGRHDPGDKSGAGLSGTSCGGETTLEGPRRSRVRAFLSPGGVRREHAGGDQPGMRQSMPVLAGGWAQLPVRHVEFNRFRQNVDAALATGRPVGLIGSDLAGHPQLEEVLTYIADREGRFSLSSIRPEGLTSRMIELLARGGQKTATLAPEVASPRMKKLIGKEIPSESFYQLVEQLVNAGIPNVRFYFMIGLPTETEEDVQAVVDFILEARRVFVNASRSRKKIGKIGVQVNPFVPKPWTPFQWAGQRTVKELEKRVRILQHGLRKEPNLVLRVESPRQAAIQAFLSRGDRRIGADILQAAQHDGKWPGFLRKEAKRIEFYVYRERSGEEILPWEITSHGVTREKLWGTFVRAMAEASGNRLL